MSNSVEPAAVGELHEGADEEEPMLLLLPVKASNDNGVAPDNGDDDEDNGDDNGDDNGEDAAGGEGDGAVSELRSSDVGGVNPPPVSEEDVDVDEVVSLVGDIGGVDEANNAALVPLPLKSTVLMSLLFPVLLLLLPPPIKSHAPFSKASTILLKDDWVGEGGDVEEEVDEVDEVSREEGEVSKVIPSVLALSRN